MKSEPATFSALRADEVDAAVQLFSDAFYESPDRSRARLTGIGLDHWWAGRIGSRLVACGRFDRTGHWFGGRIVPTGSLAAGATLPEFRGSGVLTAFMVRAIEEAKQ